MLTPSTLLRTLGCFRINSAEADSRKPETTKAPRSLFSSTLSLCNFLIIIEEICPCFDDSSNTCATQKNIATLPYIDFSNISFQIFTHYSEEELGLSLNSRPASITPTTINSPPMPNERDDSSSMSSSTLSSLSSVSLGDTDALQKELQSAWNNTIKKVSTTSQTRPSSQVTTCFDSTKSRCEEEKEDDDSYQAYLEAGLVF